MGTMETMENSSIGEHGHNLYMCWSSGGSTVTGRTAVDSWYSGIKDYKFGDGKFSMATGHFTQVVWAGSREVGVARACSADGKTVYVVANYRPAGNVEGAFNNNVQPLRTDAVIETCDETINEPPVVRDSRDVTTDDDETFIQGALAAHNEHRRKHGSGPLTHAPDLSAIAQTVADGLAKMGRIEHCKTSRPSAGGEPKTNHYEGNADQNNRQSQEPIKAQDAGKTDQLRANGEQERTLDVNKTGESQDCGERLYSQDCKDNLYMFWSPDDACTSVNGNETGGSWYGEIKDYDFQNNNFSFEAGRFTRVVCSGGQTVGVAKAFSMDGRTLYVMTSYGPSASVPTPTMVDENVNPDRNLTNPVDADPTKTAKRPARTNNTPTTVEEAEQFIQEALDAHNFYRKKHGSPPLTHNPALTAYAQNWANTLSRAKEVSMDHSRCRLENGTKIGENIYLKETQAREMTVRAADAVQSWYEEIEEHDFECNDFCFETGHFTQVIWAGTREVGVAKAFSPDGRAAVIVANYRPPGNYDKKYFANIKPAAEPENESEM